MKSTGIFFGIIGLLIIIGFAMALVQGAKNPNGGTPSVWQTSSFEECVAAGNPVMESYPRQCIDATGNHFVEDVAVQVPDGGGVIVGNGCAVGGCSGQICGEKSEVDGLVTTCEWREEYACYQSARCERQASGECGWTQTSELARCLLDARGPGSAPSEVNVY